MKRLKILISLLIIISFTGCVEQNSGSDNIFVKELTISLENFIISPSTITVNQGDFVRLIVQNDEGEHNFYLEGYNLKTEISEAPDTQVIEFLADEKGNFDFWCEVRDHREKGMEGFLIVR
jgi:plastocyanin